MRKWTGMRLNITDCKGNTPLHLAIKAKASLLANDLIRKGANGDLKNKKEKTARQMAVDSGMQGVFDDLYLYSSVKPLT